MAETESDRDRERALAWVLRNTPAGPPHLDEPTLLDFHRGRLPGAREDVVRAHLGACASCVEIARDASRFLEAMGESAPVQEPRRLPSWLPLAAVVLLALGGASLWLATREADRWSALPVSATAWPLSAEEELLWRSGEDDDFAAAMEPYARGDYAAAEAELSRYLQSRPGDPRALFYRGVSLLMLGRADEARPALESASRAATGPARDEASWYLALSALKSGDREAAVRELEQLAGLDGSRRDEAAALLRRIRGD